MMIVNTHFHILLHVHILLYDKGTTYLRHLNSFKPSDALKKLSVHKAVSSAR